MAGLPEVGEQVGRFSDAAGLDLLRLGTTANAEEIKDTAYTQPLLVALGVIAADQLGLLHGTDASERVVAGHSVGELTAAAVAGAFTATEAVAFAARRGAEMAAACALTPTGMSALLGGQEDAVLAAVRNAGLTAANRNGAGQIVAAGALDALEKLAAEPPAGVRVRPLQVAGAFHTHFMAPAPTRCAEHVGGLEVLDPRPILLSNADGTAVDNGAELVQRLVRQVTLPVRWDLCMRACADLAVTAVLELAPGGVLAGIAKRELAGVEIVAVRDAGRPRRRTDTAGKPAGIRPGRTHPDFRIAATPAKGVFTRAESIHEGSHVDQGARIGTVRTNRDEHAVLTTQAGVLTEWLRNDGDIVAAGLPVARLSVEQGR